MTISVIEDSITIIQVQKHSTMMLGVNNTDQFAVHLYEENKATGLLNHRSRYKGKSETLLVETDERNSRIKKSSI